MWITSIVEAPQGDQSNGIEQENGGTLGRSQLLSGAWNVSHRSSTRCGCCLGEQVKGVHLSSSLHQPLLVVGQFAAASLLSEPQPQQRLHNLSASHQQHWMASSPGTVTFLSLGVSWANGNEMWSRLFLGSLDATNPIPSMGLVYLPAWIVDFYGFHVGKYTSPMDAVGIL